MAQTVEVKLDRGQARILERIAKALEEQNRLQKQPTNTFNTTTTENNESVGSEALENALTEQGLFFPNEIQNVISAVEQAGLRVVRTT